MRSLLSEVGVRAEGVRDKLGLTNGEGGMSGAEVAEVAEVFRASHLQEHVLPALDGCDIGVRWPVLSEKLVLVLLAVDGLDMAGDSALRKSV